MKDEKRHRAGEVGELAIDPRADLSGLSQWAPELAEAFVSLSSDIALVNGDGGIIERVVQSSQHPIAPSLLQSVGRPWADTVTRGHARQDRASPQ